MGWCLTFVGAGNEELALALDHFLRAGDLSGQGWAHQIAALAYAMRGDWAESAAQAGQALPLFQQAGDQTGQAWVTASIGSYHARLGNYNLARGYARQALEGPATGESTSLSMAWDALGVTHFRLGEPREAIGCFLRGLALVRDL
jgi:tetratricopeptide (TPR) repeat protein